MFIRLFHPRFEAVGGAELLTVAHGRLLAAVGHRVRITTFSVSDRWKGLLEGLPVDTVPRQHWTDLVRFGDGARHRVRAVRVGKRLVDADVVIASNYPANALLAAADVPGRKLWYCHEPSRLYHFLEANPNLTRAAEAGRLGELWIGAWFEGEAARFRRRLHAGGAFSARRAFDLSAAVGILDFAVNSTSVKENAQRVYGATASRVIYPVVDMAPAASRPKALDPDRLQVLTLARLIPEKNTDAVVRGFAHFHQRRPRALLHVVGDGPLRGPLEQLVAERGLGDAVKVHGFLAAEALQALMNQCDVFAMLPYDEPFGMVFPEAAVKGMLVVGSNHGGPLEILDHGRYGWCVDPASPEAFAQTLEEICDLSASDVAQRRAEALDSCTARFGSEAIGPQLCAWVDGL